MAKNIEYYAYSLDSQRYKGTLTYPDDGSYHGKLLDLWQNSFDEEVIHFTYWKGKWFKGDCHSNNMTSLTVDQLPKDLQMKALVGAL